MEGKTGKLYVTKYALTAGIKEVDEWKDIGDNYARVEGSWVLYMLGRDAFTDRSDAVADCEKRRVEKIKSIKKQISKIEALVF